MGNFFQLRSLSKNTLFLRLGALLFIAKLIALHGDKVHIKYKSDKVLFKLFWLIAHKLCKRAKAKDLKFFNSALLRSRKLRMIPKPTSAVSRRPLRNWTGFSSPTQQKKVSLIKVGFHPSVQGAVRL